MATTTKKTVTRTAAANAVKEEPTAAVETVEAPAPAVETGQAVAPTAPEGEEIKQSPRPRRVPPTSASCRLPQRS